MALFGDDEDEHDPAAADPPESDDPGGPTESEDADPADPSEEGEESPEEASAEQAPEDEGSGEEGLDVEEALKDLSARMAMLSSNLEGVQESRAELEEKLGTVEQRMSRLGSLAEAVSSEYNPFISENAPESPAFSPEFGDEPADGAGEGAPAGPSGGAGDAPAADEDDGRRHPAPEAARAMSEAHPDLGPDAEGSGGGEATPAPEPPEAGAAGDDGHGDEAALAGASPLEHARAEPIEDVEPTPAADPFEAADRASGFGAPDEDFEENMLLLEWVGMMLDRVGRAGLMDLLDYYQNLGWLDPATKQRATRVAIGVEAPDRVDGHWRGDLDLHRRSLVAIQRLQGNEVPAAHIDELQLDLRRLFEE